MAGFEFRETMSGTWRPSAGGPERAIEFTITARAGGLLRHLLDRKADMEGRLRMEGFAADVPITGELVIDPLLGVLTFGLLALVWVPAAVAQQLPRYIIGVTDVPAAVRAIEASGGRVIEHIPLIDALVVGIPEEALRGIERAPFVRYVEPDPDEAVWTQEDTLPYGVDNIDAEVVWGGAQRATNVIPGRGGAGDPRVSRARPHTRSYPHSDRLEHR